MYICTCIHTLYVCLVFEAHRLLIVGQLSLRQTLAAPVPARRADGGRRTHPGGEGHLQREIAHG